MKKALNQQDELASLTSDNAALLAENKALKKQLVWLKKQIFGPKSERRVGGPNPAQLELLQQLADKIAETSEQVEQATISYQRGKAKKQRSDDCVTDAGLRFDDTVPVEVIKLPCPELEGPHADEYEQISTKVTHTLAQRPAAFVVLQYEQAVVKRKNSGDIIATSTSNKVFERSIADVSFLVGMLVDKFQYHLPLYRQHQRLINSGIQLSRSTLTNLTKRSIDLLSPIVDAQLGNVLRSKVMAMDETPGKVSRGKNARGQGKMKTGWFWPMFGDQDEIVFTFSMTRARSHIDEVLADKFSGVLLTDGYAAYLAYTEATKGVTLAQCWSHSRRKILEAEESEPDLVEQALQLIRGMYAVEAEIKKKSLSGDKKQVYRAQYSKPICDVFFAWCETQLENASLLPDNPLIKAVNYVMNRRDALQVFLENPDVAPDTNHIERQIRVIPQGRKNWNFCWTELGAQHVGVIQSLICTCKLQGVDPYTYLVDVLQRVSLHPAKDVIELTPRIWKEKFADHPLGSDLSLRCNNGVE